MTSKQFIADAGRAGRRPLTKVCLSLLVALGLIFSAGHAFAEDDEDKEPVEEKLETYWSVDRELQVVKDRLHERSGRFALGLIVGLNSSEPFFWYNPVGARLDYYFSNFTGLEVEGTFMDAPGVLSHDTELTDFLKTARSEAFDAKLDTEDRFLWRANALFVWHPMYGKLAFLQRKLAHFDFNLALGGGVVSVERPNETRTEAITAIEPELAFGGGVHFFASESFVLRLDGRGYLYRGAVTPVNEGKIGKQLEVPTEFMVGASFMF